MVSAKWWATASLFLNKKTSLWRVVLFCDIMCMYLMGHIKKSADVKKARKSFLSSFVVRVCPYLGFLSVFYLKMQK